MLVKGCIAVVAIPDPWCPGHADLYSVAKTVMLNVVLAGLHSLVSVQVLVFSAIITPNQDLAFVLAVSYTCICTFLGGYFVHIDSLVRPSCTSASKHIYSAKPMLQ